MKLKVGQKIYVLPINNAARREKDIKEDLIVSVGRKYFKLQNHPWSRFYIETLYEDGGQYSPDWLCYLSLKDYEDEKETNSLRRFCEDTFGHGSNIKLTLDKLRRIVKIIAEPDKIDTLLKGII
jgi:hypothetical protein